MFYTLKKSSVITFLKRRKKKKELAFHVSGCPANDSRAMSSLIYSEK